MNKTTINRPSVLIAAPKDDAEQIKAYLKKLCEVSIANNAASTFEHANKKLPEIILLSSDFLLPGSKQNILLKLKHGNNTQHIPIIFIITDPDHRSRAFRLGAKGCLLKPFVPDEVRSLININASCRQYRFELENHKETFRIKAEEQTQELNESKIEIIHRLARAAEFKDDDTGEHVWRMSEYAHAMALSAGIDKIECDLLYKAAPMHDIGKIGIPDRVLLKPGKLDQNEWEIMKTHTTIGKKILSGSKSPLLEMAAEVAGGHHEKWDGSGYPKGLKEKHIPIWCRIVAMADVFDALTSKRPYKNAWPVEKAIEVIKQESGKHFEPQLVNIFIKILPKIMEIKKGFEGSEREIITKEIKQIPFIKINIKRIFLQNQYQLLIDTINTFKNRRQVVLDLSEVCSIGSTAWGAIFEAAKKINISVIGMNETCCLTFGIWGFNRLMKTFKSEEDFWKNRRAA